MLTFGRQPIPLVLAGPEFTVSFAASRRSQVSHEFNSDSCHRPTTLPKHFEGRIQKPRLKLA